MKARSRHRGHALKTMMLVISVIIAVAILGILTGFLGGNPCATQAGDVISNVLSQVLGGGAINFGFTTAEDLISTQLNQVQQKGIGFSVCKRVGFAASKIITTATVIREAPIQAENIIFECANNELCGGGADAPIELSDSRINTKFKADAMIVVCRGASGDRKYHVCIGSDAVVFNACSAKCELG